MGPVKLRITAKRMTMECAQFDFNYHVDENKVVYLFVCEKGFSRKLAFAQLDKVVVHFKAAHDGEVNVERLSVQHNFQPVLRAYTKRAVRAVEPDRVGRVRGEVEQVRH